MSAAHVKTPKHTAAAAQMLTAAPPRILPNNNSTTRQTKQTSTKQLRLLLLVSLFSLGIGILLGFIVFVGFYRSQCATLLSKQLHNSTDDAPAKLKELTSQQMRSAEKCVFGRALIRRVDVMLRTMVGRTMEVRIK
jgi:hypothetical protein